MFSWPSNPFEDHWRVFSNHKNYVGLPWKFSFRPFRVRAPAVTSRMQIFQLITVVTAIGILGKAAQEKLSFGCSTRGNWKDICRSPCNHGEHKLIRVSSWFWTHVIADEAHCATAGGGTAGQCGCLPTRRSPRFQQQTQRKICRAAQRQQTVRLAGKIFWIKIQAVVLFCSLMDRKNVYWPSVNM